MELALLCSTHLKDTKREQSVVLVPEGKRKFLIPKRWSDYINCVLKK